ncbi:MAG: glycosyltransferase family 4 protein [Nitrososphaera sp.]
MPHVQDNRIRVLQLANPTKLYGAERWILALVKHLDNSRIESVVSAIKDAPDHDAPICAKAARAGSRTHVFEAYGRVNFLAVKRLRNYIIENAIDIVHTHGYKTDIIGLLATVGTRCRIVSTPHGWSQRAGIKLQIYETLDRMIFPFFDAVAPLSTELYAGLKKIPGLNGKLHLIRNGVDTSEIESVQYTSNEMKSLRAEGTVTIGYTGQLIRRKGIDTLVHAFSQVNLPKKRLCIIGEGPLRAEIELLTRNLGIQDSVTFYGFREDRIVLLKGFDVFVLPSRLEGIPRCVMEAMAAGVPVIASNISGCRKLIGDGDSGILFEVGNADDLAAKIERLVADPDRRRTLSQNAKNRVCKLFSASRMASDYSTLYSALLRSRR